MQFLYVHVEKPRLHVTPASLILMHSVQVCSMACSTYVSATVIEHLGSCVIVFRYAV